MLCDQPLGPWFYKHKQPKASTYTDRLTSNPKADAGLHVVLSFIDAFHPASETLAFKATLEGAHLILEFQRRTVLLRRFEVYENHIMLIPHKKIVFVDITKLDAELMQPTQSLLAVVDIH
ncbi:hypothetical protein HG531_009713 [Fusarium graminearum]|nr:hypothetical protein HG531_009713 [Fusarium graminearum]